MTTQRLTDPECRCPSSADGRARPPVPHPASAFTVTKLFDDFPCCHRAWAHDGKCAFLHGYERTFEIEFACAELDPVTGFVVDFGALKGVRSLLAAQFDHTTLVAEDDPERTLFEELAARGVVDMRVMRHTGMEGAAAWVLDQAGRLIRESTNGRVWISRVEARECRKNAVVLTSAGTGPA
ncbi:MULTISPECIES: 6-carboxytetrahydropterin synthase [unclassified Streptomyces]|uniref:6-pyruvoyl trahydropterin synthase family protein n=1 Tax=unclassified Streptomyces TaxID=2593676 RepID=UPI00168AA9D5|nr:MULTISPECIES: 6-carboxytetrahydropterin synthase [unclassified Streptomyces]MBD3003823.1 6-carboxytetrahydropterin synthase [Streptomyces sp. 5-10]